VRQPWRMATMWLGADEMVRTGLSGRTESQLRTLVSLAAQPTTLRTTSMGRLFDAAAALTGGPQTVTYEAEAAAHLEALALAVPPDQALDLGAVHFHRHVCLCHFRLPLACAASGTRERSRHHDPADMFSVFDRPAGVRGR